MRAFVLSALLVFAGGCTVAPLDLAQSEPAKNACESNDDCGEGICDPALRVCRASQGQFSTVLFEITAPATSGEWSGVRALQTLSGLSTSGGPLDLDLGFVAQVHGSITPTKAGFEQECELSYGATASSTVPVKLTFTPSERVLGLPADFYVASTKPGKEGDFEFDLKLPAGDYDIYVEPDQDVVAQPSSTGLPSCTVVPQLYRKQTVQASDNTLPLVAQPPELFSVVVEWPAPSTMGGDENALSGLDGWVVDVIEPKTGRVLSAPALLALDSAASNAEMLHYTADVAYAPVIGEAANLGKELVRLQPPEGVVAPTVVFERGTLDAFQTGKARINQIGGVPQPVMLKDLFIETEAGELVTMPANVKLVAKKLSFLPEGTLFAFERTVEASAGKVEVELLPGDYDVYVLPSPGSGLATTKTELSVAPEPKEQCCKVLKIAPSSQIAGSALGPSGSPVTGASVHAVAAPFEVDPLLLAAGATPVKPQAIVSIVNPKGGFLVQADPGVFDFSIRPDDGTGFAWLVRPNVDISKPLHDLGALNLPLPVPYTGVVQVPGDVPLPRALIRAYLFLNDGGYTASPAEAKSVLQIAETRAGDDGSFTLLLPAHLN